MLTLERSSTNVREPMALLPQDDDERPKIFTAGNDSQGEVTPEPKYIKCLCIPLGLFLIWI